MVLTLFNYVRCISFLTSPEIHAILMQNDREGESRMVKSAHSPRSTNLFDFIFSFGLIVLQIAVGIHLYIAFLAQGYF